MRLFNGLDRSDYQDILRAVGRLCDTNNWRNLRLIECDEGLILQYSTEAAQREFASYLLTDDDLQAMLRESYTFREHKAARRFNAPGV